MKEFHNYGLVNGAQNEKWQIDFCVSPGFKKSVLGKY